MEQQRKIYPREFESCQRDITECSSTTVRLTITLNLLWVHNPPQLCIQNDIHQQNVSQITLSADIAGNCFFADLKFFFLFLLCGFIAKMANWLITSWLDVRQITAISAQIVEHISALKVERHFASFPKKKEKKLRKFKNVSQTFWHLWSDESKLVWPPRSAPHPGCKKNWAILDLHHEAVNAFVPDRKLRRRQ